MFSTPTIHMKKGKGGKELLCSHFLFKRNVFNVIELYANTVVNR